MEHAPIAASILAAGHRLALHGAGRWLIVAAVVAIIVIVLVVLLRRRGRRRPDSARAAAGRTPAPRLEARGREARTTEAGPRGVLGRIGRFCAEHRWWVIGAWAIVLVGAFLGNRAFGGTYSDDFTLGSSPAQQGADILKAHEPSAGGQGGQIVFTVESGTLATDRAAIEQSMSAVAALPHVLGAADPFSHLSDNGRTAYASVQFAANPSSYGESYLQRVDDSVAPATKAGVEVDYGGQLGQADRPKAKDIASEGIGIGAALLILLVGFGSVLAAGIPILTAIIGAVSGLGILGMIAASTTFPQVSPTLAVMMGLGVGIDYALFLSTRHRQQVMDGVDPVTAASRTVAASGGAIVTAAATVVAALLSLYASGLTFIGELGLAAGITVAVGAGAALTLVPAVLALAGRRIDRLHVRRPVAEPRGQGSGWVRYAALVRRRPLVFLGAGLIITVILAIPVTSIELGHIDAGADPTSYSDRKAYDAIGRDFGVGANSPITLVVALDTGRTTTAAARTALGEAVQTAVEGAGDVASVTPLRATDDGAALVGTVIPASSPQATATDTLVDTLQNTTLPDALRGSGATGYVTGSLAAQLEFRDEVAARLPIIIVTVIAAAFVLLILAFRSPVLAVKAGVMNLLSVGAAYGVIVAVFQWGWGGQLFGVAGTVPIESYIPMMMFAIVFGLSMDYEVFLLSRVREAWLLSRDNADAVASGLASTARVIGSAALIMASVFLSFLLSGSIVIKILALGLGASVLIDAFVIRLLLVPALMFLLGRANWWVPRWLDRLLGGFTLGGDEPLPPLVSATEDRAAPPAVGA